jgi:hypothetical protein
MRVEYEPTVSTRVREIISKAKEDDLEINCIKLLKKEWDRFHSELGLSPRYSVGASSFTLAPTTYDGIKIIREKP